MAKRIARLYIAGGMSPASFGLSYTPVGWDYNHPEFNRVASLCRGAGYEVVNPAELDEQAGDVGDHEWAFYLRRDIKVLADCDGIVLLQGWEHSRGARLEHHIASELGMEVIPLHELDAFLEAV